MKSFLKIGFCCGVALFLASCSNAPDDSCKLPDVIKIDRVKPYHRVRNGETVGSIAQKYKMSRAEIIKLNNLEPPYQLYEGQRLIVNISSENLGIEEINVVANEQQSESVDQNKEEAIEPKQVDVEQQQEEKRQEDQTIDDIKADEEKKVESPKKTSEYVWPIVDRNAKISTKFGDEGVEGGIVIDSSAGTPVRAIADGIVIISGVPSGEASAYGMTVAIKHPNKKKMSIYSYLKETNVEIHQTVRKGDIIGKVGKSGTRASKPQLYFEISDVSGKGRRSIDPEKLIPNE